MHPSEELEHQLTRWSYSQMKKTEKQTIAQIHIWPSDRHTALSKATISTTSTNQPSFLPNVSCPQNNFYYPCTRKKTVWSRPRNIRWLNKPLLTNRDSRCQEKILLDECSPRIKSQFH